MACEAEKRDCQAERLVVVYWRCYVRISHGWRIASLGCAAGYAGEEFRGSRGREFKGLRDWGCSFGALAGCGRDGGW